MVWVVLGLLAIWNILQSLQIRGLRGALDTCQKKIQEDRTVINEHTDTIKKLKNVLLKRK